MMAMATTLDQNGLSGAMPKGSEADIAALRESYQHLCKLRDEVIEMGVLPPLAEWEQVNPNLK